MNKEYIKRVHHIPRLLSRVPTNAVIGNEKPRTEESLDGSRMRRVGGIEASRGVPFSGACSSITKMPTCLGIHTIGSTSRLPTETVTKLIGRNRKTKNGATAYQPSWILDRSCHNTTLAAQNASSRLKFENVSMNCHQLSEF